MLTECPIFTADGVKAADVAWASDETMRELRDRPCFPRAPGVCVEVLSPRNTDAEIPEKTALYFDGGAREVWICAESGGMSFLARHRSAPMSASESFPEFPSRITLR